MKRRIFTLSTVLTLYAASSFCALAKDVTDLDALNSSAKLRPPSVSGYNQPSPYATTPRESSSKDTRKWHNYTYSRSAGATYRNTTSNPIIIAVSPSGTRWEEMKAYVNGLYFGRVYSGDFGGGGSISMEVPPNGTYKVTIWNERGQPAKIITWLEFR